MLQLTAFGGGFVSSKETVKGHSTAEGHFVCACSLEGAFNEENRWYAPPKRTNGDRRE